MLTGIDHVVLLSAGLNSAIRGFESVGFSVLRGGSHPDWGTENALISFADGCYLELLAAREPSAAARHRLWRRADGGSRRPGEYGGYALESDSLPADVEAAAARGLEFAAPVLGERRWPDGRGVRWRLAISTRPDFPFLIEDLTPRSARVPTAVGSLNARTRLAAVTVAVASMAEASLAYAALLERPAVPVGLGRNAIDTDRGRIVLIDLAHAPGDHPAPGVAAVSLAVVGGTNSTLTDVTGGAILNLVVDDSAV